MTRHLAKLIWHRKKANALVVLEIFFSFIVLFAVAVLALSCLHTLRQPLGFEYKNVWAVSIDARDEGHDRATPEDRGGLERVLQAARSLDAVEAAAGTLIVPYEMSTARDDTKVNGREVLFGFSDVTDGFREVMGVKLVAGRWFSREDDGAAYRPTVITRDLARELFGDADALGREIPRERSGKKQISAEDRERVVGVMEAYKGEGEFVSLPLYALYRCDLSREKTRTPRHLVLRVKPGTPVAFEETLVKTLQATAHDWSFTVEPLLETRDAALRRNLIPVVSAGLVGGFLMLMVGLGLTGVLWQNVTKRTKEIGLRRAAGATGRQVSLQITGEIWIVTTLALVLGVIVVVQLPLLDVLGFVPPPLYAASVAVAVAAMYLLTTLCAFYPGWLATRVAPSEALRYE